MSEQSQEIHPLIRALGTFVYGPDYAKLPSDQESWFERRKRATRIGADHFSAMRSSPELGKALEAALKEFAWTRVREALQTVQASRLGSESLPDALPSLFSPKNPRPLEAEGPSAVDGAGLGAVAIASAPLYGDNCRKIGISSDPREWLSLADDVIVTAAEFALKAEAAARIDFDTAVTQLAHKCAEAGGAFTSNDFRFIIKSSDAFKLPVEAYTDVPFFLLHDVVVNDISLPNVRAVEPSTPSL